MKKLIVIFLLFGVAVSAYNFVTIYENAVGEQIKQIPTDTRAGDIVTLKMNLYNTSTDNTSRDVNIQLNTPEGFDCISCKTNINRISPRFKQPISFIIKVDDKIPPGTYPLSVHIEFVDNKEIKESGTKTIWIDVSGNEKPIIENIVGPEKIEIGGAGSVEVSVKNVGEVPAHDVETSITYSSNKIRSKKRYYYKKTLYGGETQNYKFTFTIPQDIETGEYTYTIDVNWSGGSTSQTYTFSIVDLPRVEISGVSTDKKPVAGDDISLSIQLENIGKKQARAVSMKLVADWANGDKEDYIGTMDPDDTGSGVFDISINKKVNGIVNGKVQIEYLVDGNRKTVEKEFSLYVKPAKKDKNSLNILYGVIAVLLYMVYRWAHRNWRIKNMHR